MTKPAPATTEDSPTTAESAAPPARSLMSKLKIVGFIVAVIVGEWVVALLLMPSSAKAPQPTESDSAQEEESTKGDEPAADQKAGHEKGKSQGHEKADKKEGHDKGKKEGHDKGKKEGHDKGEKKEGSHAEQEEVSLGQFTVTAYQPVSSTTLFISFHLYATIQYKNSDEFSRRLEDNKHRIRDNVIVIIRSAELTDLTDAGLGLIKRRILETTNKTLGKPLLQAVVFSEFSFIEQ
jgi:flagellar basal body-associated protein FliL